LGDEAPLKPWRFQIQDSRFKIPDSRSPRTTERFRFARVVTTRARTTINTEARRHRGKQVIGHRLQVTGYRLWVTGYRREVTGHRSQVTGYRWCMTERTLILPCSMFPALSEGVNKLKNPHFFARKSLETGMGKIRISIFSHVLRSLFPLSYNLIPTLMC
jgi:hypothetical protein